MSHAAILDGTTGAQAVNGDIYGVSDSSLDPNTDEFNNEGDDQVLSVWSWLNFANVNVKAGYIPFSLIALLTGETVTSSGTTPNDYYSVPLWTTRALNVGPKPMLIRVPSRDSLGAARTLDIVLYKVQFAPITFDGPKYKDGLKVNYVGKALPSVNDETGAALGYTAVGRLMSHP